MGDAPLFDVTPYLVFDKRGWRTRPRTVDPRGYVLVRLAGHHRADVRGYVYEHVLVMESILKRQLRAGERVRHRDGDPGNNEPENLELILPLDRTSRVTCACGCGASLTHLDSAGRSRSYVSGHNPAATPTTDAVLAALAVDPRACLTPAEIASTVGISRRAAAIAASRMSRRGLVERVRVGYYRLPGSSAAAPPPARNRPKWEWGAGLPSHLKESLTENFGGLCAYGCWRPAATWDHLIPWVRGGSFRWPGNAVPACKPCNISKNSRHPGPWVLRGLSAEYSSEPMEGVITLAVCWGAADPDDFLDPALCDPALDQFPEDLRVREYPAPVADPGAINQAPAGAVSRAEEATTR